MLLCHAQALAIAEVIRGGITYPKTAKFSKEQLAAEDWEPVYPVPIPPVVPEDCPDCPK